MKMPSFSLMLCVSTGINTAYGLPKLAIVLHCIRQQAEVNEDYRVRCRARGMNISGPEE